MSIKGRVLWTMLGMCLLVAILGAVAVERQRAAAMKGATQEAENVARVLGFLFVAGAESNALQTSEQEIVNRLHRTQGRDVAVVDTKQRILADAIPAEIGHIYTDDLKDEVGATIKDRKVRTFVEVSAAYPQGVKQIVVPIESGRGEVLGAVILEYTPLYVEMMGLTKTTILQVTLVGAGCLALALLIGFFAERSISIPLHQLAKAAKAFATGRTDLQMPPAGKGEIGELVVAFSRMIALRQQNEEALQRANGELESRVKERTAELAGERQRLDDILNNIPAVVFEYLGGKESPHRTSFVSAHTEEMYGYTREEWQATPDFWLSRVHPDDRERMAADVTEVFAGRRVRSKPLLRWLTKDDRVIWGETHLVGIRDGAGRTIGVRGVTFDVTDRVRTDEELRWKTAFLEAQTESSPDGILVVDKQGQSLLKNRKMIEIWNLPPQLRDQRDDEAMLRHAVTSIRHPDPFLKRVAHLYEHPNEVGRDEIELNDGRFLDRYTSPVFGADGTYYGRIWTFRDITERKRKEAEAEDLNGQLVSLSREAGMAEVATSVLHNVGNVLNSVNISLGVATDKVGRLKSEGLVRIAALLREHAGNLPGFFAEHPQGIRLPAFLGRLAEHFAADQQIVLRELDSLRANLEHINEIVAMQQNYATTCGVIEMLTLADVIEDALRMNSAAFERHGTCVCREFDAAIPPLPLDRNKMLLILVNLIRNAKYACDEGGRAEKCITLRTRLNGRGCAQVSVSDNGVGIPPENLTRIFEHGFTTRAKGHGFGLHSSALAAAEMGGSLSGLSDGPGCGATFTLELPLTSKP